MAVTMNDVVCIALMAADIVARRVSGFHFDKDSEEVESISLTNGGDAFNTAVNLVTLGVGTTLIGKVGDDALGRFLLARADMAGVNTDAISVDPMEPTCTSIAIIDGSGERRFIHSTGANRSLCPEDIDSSMFTNYRVVHLGGACALPLLDGVGLAYVAREARRAGCITTMDVTWDKDGAWLEKIEAALPHLDYFLPSVNELKLIAGTEDPERAATHMLSLGVSHTIVKLGASGCLVATKTTTEYVAGYRVECVADTTGAGDAFVAGFISGLCRDWPLIQCARFANAVGSCAVRAVGATEGVTGIESALALIESE